MSTRIVRFAAALTLAASFAGPAAHAAGPLRAGSAGVSLFDLAWSWLATAWSDKGFSIDPDGLAVQAPEPRAASEEADRGFTIDPNGLAVQAPEPRAASEEADKGFTIDPNG